MTSAVSSRRLVSDNVQVRIPEKDSNARSARLPRQTTLGDEFPVYFTLRLATDLPMPSKLLSIGNPSKTIDNLTGIIDGLAIDAIKREYNAQVALLYALSLDHYRFAVKQPPRQWRQKVSRLYYAAYAASRAIRLCVHGHFSTEVDEHKKVGRLPDDFPNRGRFNNKLDILREDRNTSDYDLSCCRF